MVHLTKATKPVREKDIRRAWHLFDAKGKVLGRLISAVAQCLMGKNKVNYVSYLDMGDYAVVINAKDVVVTGAKHDAKIYSRYSGYPGGLKKISYAKMKREKPEEIIRHAVLGMLPKNTLRDRRMTRLFVFKGNMHPYESKLKMKSFPQSGIPLRGKKLKIVNG